MYGFPSYREANPALFTIITFPFFFGIMFGDIGHGGMLFLFAIFIFLKPDTIRRNVHPLLVDLRWLVLLMGFFALYMGFIYNDCMSFSLEVFGQSCYTDAGEWRSDQCVYPFGMDPIWTKSENDILMYNSFKMKTSVIIGVC